MSHSERARIEASARRLREVAKDLRQIAPSASVRADALAAEVELKIKRLDAVTYR